MSVALPTRAGPATSGMALMLVTMAVMGAMDAAAKTLVADYAPWQVLFVRHALLLAFCLAWFGPRRVASLLVSKRPGLQFVRVTVLIVEIGMVLFAFRFLPLADTHAVLAVAPLLVTALAFWLLGEPVGIRRWAAVAVGFVGVLIILRPGLGVFQPIALLPLGAALLWAVYQVLSRKVAAIDSSETTFLWLVVAGFVVPGLTMPWLWRTPDAWFDVSLFLLVSVLGAVGHFLLLLALRVAAASTLQPFSYTLLVWAAIWGWLVFGDVPDLATCAGAAIVVASGLYTWHRERRRALR
jgi:drug/metabolite transporter (DMT)-like permease